MVAFENISVRYGKKEILREVCFAPRPGRLTAILGKNGSGKTTLISCLAGNVKYTGRVTLDGKELKKTPPREAARHISVLPQMLPDTQMTVSALVEMGRNPYINIGQKMSNSDITAVQDAIEAVGMSRFCDTPICDLSGGEKQKAYIAMALAQDADIMVFDEPTTYLDPQNSRELMTLIKDLRDRRGKTVLTILHDVNAALHYADDILVIDEHRAAFFGTAEECIEREVIERTFSLAKFTDEKSGITVFCNT